MSKETRIDPGIVDTCVLEILNSRSPNEWSTAKSLLPDILPALLADVEGEIEASLQRLYEDGLVMSAFNNVGDKSYIVYQRKEREQGVTRQSAFDDGVKKNDS